MFCFAFELHLYLYEKQQEQKKEMTRRDIETYIDNHYRIAY